MTCGLRTADCGLRTGSYCEKLLAIDCSVSE
jgi:hypothetical protein